MPTRRTPRQHSIKRRITPAAVDAFRRGDWEGVYAALDLRPWLTNPLDVKHPEPPAWMDEPRRIADWREAWALRQELLEQAGG